MNADNIHIFDYLHLLRRRKATIIVSFFSVLLIVFLVNLKQKPVYRTSAQLMLEKDQKTLVFGTSILTVDAVDDTYFFTQRRVLKSKPIAELIVQLIIQDTPNLAHYLDCFGIEKPKTSEFLSEQQRNGLMGSIQGAVDLESIPKTTLFYITVTGNDPVAVAGIANIASDVFVEYNARSQLSNSQQAFLTFTSKLQEIKDRMTLSGIALKKVQLDLKLAEMLKTYEDKHPDVIKLRDQVNGYSEYLKQQLNKVRETLGADRIAREQRENILFSYLATEEARQGLGLEGRKNLVLFLEQEDATNRDMYNTFFKKFQEINLASDQITGRRISIIEQATVPGAPLRPNKKMNLLFGCFVGLVLGVGLAFFQDYLDNSIKTSDEVQRYLNLLILGMIPELPEKNKGTNGKSQKGRDNPLHRLVTLNDTNSPISEAYRTMRTNILLSAVDRPLKTLVVTSSVQKEGKSTTAINLAISIARSGSKVVLVESDLRRPILAKTFGIYDKSKADIVDLLSASVDVDTVLYPSGIENLSLLPCMKIPPNPSELLGSNRMKNIVDILKEKFDLVIMDSPPLVAVTDAVVLSAKMDGVIMVVRAGAVPRGICMQAKASLDNAKANILGVVLNNVNMDQSSYHYYHYYRYYNSYTGTSPSPAVRETVTAQ